MKECILKIYKLNIKGLNIEVEETKDGKFIKPYIMKKYNSYHGGIAPLKQTLESILVFRKNLKNKSMVDDIMEYESNKIYRIKEGTPDNIKQEIIEYCKENNIEYQ